MSAQESAQSAESAEVRALTVRDLRERLADLPDSTQVYVETIVGGNLVNNDTALMDARLVTTADGYYLRLLPDPADPYGTRELIDHGLAAREVVGAILDDHGDCFEGQPIHQVVGEGDDAECMDDCTGCCADEVIHRLRDLAVEDDRRVVNSPGQTTSGGTA